MDILVLVLTTLNVAKIKILHFPEFVFSTSTMGIGLTTHKFSPKYETVIVLLRNLNEVERTITYRNLFFLVIEAEREQNPDFLKKCDKYL
jgi:hypothetical protein